MAVTGIILQQTNLSMQIDDAMSLVTFVSRAM